MINRWEWREHFKLAGFPDPPAEFLDRMEKIAYDHGIFLDVVVVVDILLAVKDQPFCDFCKLACGAQCQ